ncbi:MAG: NUDIX hydrolase [Deltaproteobacteria bacterium]|nr:NUDIX hydrolase [Deltaproteobacteria bacterium]
MRGFRNAVLYQGGKRLSTCRTPVYHGAFLDLGVEEVTLPDGRPLRLEVVRHPGGAAAVAVDDARNVCLLRQYRHAGGGWLWEVPAGKIDPGESPAETARRELEEEAGVRASRWDGLGSILTTPGFCDEVIHLYLARELTAVPARPGAHEVLEVHWVPLLTAWGWARDGEIRDAKTVAALFRAWEGVGR